MAWYGREKYGQKTLLGADAIRDFTPKYGLKSITNRNAINSELKINWMKIYSAFSPLDMKYYRMMNKSCFILVSPI